MALKAPNLCLQPFFERNLSAVSTCYLDAYLVLTRISGFSKAEGEATQIEANFERL